MGIWTGGAGGGDVEGVRVPRSKRLREGVEIPVVLRSRSSSEPGGVVTLRRLGGGLRGLEGLGLLFAAEFAPFFNHGRVRVISMVTSYSM